MILIDFVCFIINVAFILNSLKLSIAFPGPFISFMPTIPIYVEPLTLQTIIYSNAGGEKYFFAKINQIF